MTRLLRYMPAALAAVAGLSGCETPGSEPFLAPDAAWVSSHASDIALTRTLEQANRTQGLISSGGGAISIGGHTLSVPAGAVAQPTWFSMHVIESNAVHVRLKAWRASDGAPVIEFPVLPVQLTLDASRLDTLDPAGLVIVYLRDGTYWGETETIPSSVDTTHWTVTGFLTHFSQYALFRELSPGID